VDSVGRKDLLLIASAGMGVAASVCAWMVHLGHLDAVTGGPNEGAGVAVGWTRKDSFTTYLTRYYYVGAILLFCFCSFVSVGKKPPHCQPVFNVDILTFSDTALYAAATCSAIIPVEMFPLRARSKALALSTATFYTSEIISY
jgi:hypothetical protein